MEQVSQLAWEESVQFDPDRLEDLCAELGEEGAELTIANALEQIAVQVARIDEHCDKQDLEGVVKSCRALEHIAARIGMLTLARVSSDVRYCANKGMSPAMAATLGRLRRIGDMSVHAIWSLDDISV